MLKCNYGTNEIKYMGTRESVFSIRMTTISRPWLTFRTLKRLDGSQR